MDTGQVLIIAGYYAAAYAVCCFGGALIIGIVLIPLKRSLQRSLPDVKYEAARLRIITSSTFVGVLERFMYITAILMGRPEFIGVWLILSIIDTRKQNFKEYDIFLIGLSLSLIFAVATALLIQQLFPPFPALNQWRLSTP